MTTFAILHITGNGETYLVENMEADSFEVAQICAQALSKKYTGIIELQQEDEHGRAIGYQYRNGCYSL